MDRTLASILVGVLSFAFGALSAFAAHERKAGRAEGQQQYTTEKLGAIEQRLDKLTTDVNRIGTIVREQRTVLDIASRTGEVPRFAPRDSGEGRVIP